MRKIENSSNWHAGYLRDIHIAKTEIELNVVSAPSETVCDIYSLPSHNHQTFYCRVIKENGFVKLEYAKAIQNSVWFSEPIYMYRFEEAKSFIDHPIRHGRIFCGKKIIRNSSLERLLKVLGTLSDEQPEGLVDPSPDAEFTAIRLYENEKPSRSIIYTAPERLSFRECTEHEHERYIEYFRDLHLYIEKIIGVGIG